MASRASATGASGSRSGQFTCTGPGRPPAAVQYARQLSDLWWTAVARDGSWLPTSTNHFACEPYSLIWSIDWPAPTSRSSGGRSAVSTIRGTRASHASTTAGIRFAAALPDVHVTATGRPLAFAKPSATNPAARSSMTECARIPSCAASVSTSGAFRDPGEVTASVIPQRASSSTNACTGA
jgi:hypothetical protein